jgi:ribosome-binding factor A
MKGFRKERLGEVLLGFVAAELRGLSDPRLQFLTLTDIDVSPDLKSARIYWSSLRKANPGAESGDSAAGFLSEAEREAIEESLKKNTAFLKKRIGEELELRYVPQLIFRFDESAERGARIEELLGSIRRERA